jgi:two-component system sensor histidine kinase ChvG
MALEDVEPGERRRFLGMIQKDVARMERLLSEAREISRIDARLDDEERSIVKLDELLAALMESFRLRHTHTALHFDLALADADVAVFASADRLTQVFENLIDNAVGFSPPQGRISVALRTVGDAAEVTISDEGPGIPEEHIERVFARFFTYRPDGDPDPGHTGLGLALVRAIVEAMGGEVSAGPRSGGGTKMVVVLPLAS